MTSIELHLGEPEGSRDDEESKNAAVSKHAFQPSRDGSRAHIASVDRTARAVTPTSERIIKATSVKRRKAVEVLANRQAALPRYLGRRGLRP